MKKIVFCMGFLMALGASLRVEAQNWNGTAKVMTKAEREANLSIPAELENVSPLAVETHSGYRLGEKDIEISNIMGNSYELPDTLYQQVALVPEYDDEATVHIKIDKYGRGAISYLLKNGGWAVDTNFNVYGLLDKIATKVDDPERAYMLMSEMVVDKDDEISKFSPTTGDDKNLHLTYIGDPKLFSDGDPTPRKKLPLVTVKMVISLPESVAKKVQAAYDEAELKETNFALGLTKEKNHKNARNEYTKAIRDLVNLIKQPSV